MDEDTRALRRRWDTLLAAGELAPVPATGNGYTPASEAARLLMAELVAGIWAVPSADGQWYRVSRFFRTYAI